MDGVVDIYSRIEGDNEEPKKKEPRPLTEAEMLSWNRYLKWLESKKLRGDASLDKGGLGMEKIKEYKSLFPDELVSEEIVVPVQAEMKRYKAYALKLLEEKKAEMAEGQKKEHFMQNLSDVDGIPGQYTTRLEFPIHYMKYLDKNGKLIKVQNNGLAGVYNKLNESK